MSEETPPPLVDLQDALLDEARLRDLFGDLSLLAQIDEIQLKRGPRQHVGDQDGCPDLQTALQALLSGSVRGVQIRYRHEGTRWWDTLLRVPGGYRIVRMDVERAMQG